MATPPSIANVLSGIEETANRITYQTVPIIRTTVDSVTTIAQGKHPTPDMSQQPATVNALNSETGAMAASGFLVLGGIAVLVILMFAVRR